MPVNAHVIECGVGDAVEELYDLLAIEYLDYLDVTCEYVDGFLLHFGIRA